MKNKTFIIGFDIIADKLYVYKDEKTAAANCHTWKYIDAETAQQAKDIFTELHLPQIEE